MGFVRQRHSVTNIRRLLGLIHAPPSPCDPAEVISLDAEEAFDRVEWVTVRRALASQAISHRGFCCSIPCLNQLYSPTLTVLNLFPLLVAHAKGFHSPHLFSISLEPVLIAFETHMRQWRTGQHTEVSLYADDLLLYVHNYSLNLINSVHSLDRNQTLQKVDVPLLINQP